MSEPILPGATVGVFGSGQLGRMLALAARRMGYRVHVYSPEADTPTGQVADRETVAPYNDLDATTELFRRHGDDLAAVFVEPVAGNMGCVLPAPGFLQGVRELCDRRGALLVYDEVMTGFRVARGGYQELDPVRPDLVTLGKVIGGGLPIGAYAGPRALMERVSPVGDVYQAGTLSGNPIAVAAGRATLAQLDRKGTYEALEASGAQLASGLEELAREHDVPLCVPRQGSMLGPYFTAAPVRDLAGATASDRERWTRFFHHMLERGVLLPPSPFEAWFLSTAHDEGVIDEVLEAADGALGSL